MPGNWFGISDSGRLTSGFALVHTIPQKIL
jgi:hypothetical protein